MMKTINGHSFTDHDEEGIHTSFAVPSDTPPEENKAPDKMLDKKFPTMEIELVGARFHAHMKHNGKAASEPLPLYFAYLETQEEKHKCIKMHKIVNKLLKKVGFEF